MPLRNPLHLLNILLHRALAPRKLEKERRRLAPHARSGGPAQVHDAHLHFVHDFHGGDGDAALHDFGGGGGGVADGGEGGDGDGEGFGDDG